MSYALVNFAVTKSLAKPLKEGRGYLAFSLRGWSVMTMEKAWEPEPMVAGYIVPTVREKGGGRREDGEGGMLVSIFLFNPGP